MRFRLFSVVTRPRIALLLLILGCAPKSWHRIDVVPPEMLEGHVQIWTVGKVMRWHDVWITSDAISGIPDTTPAKCDTCRVTLLLTQVDSILRPKPTIADKTMTIAGYPIGIALL